MITKKTERRWALMYKFDHGPKLLGKYCWQGASEDDPCVKTFRTRQQAREAKKTCCYKDAIVVSVMVTYE